MSFSKKAAGERAGERRKGEQLALNRITGINCAQKEKGKGKKRTVSSFEKVHSK